MLSENKCPAYVNLTSGLEWSNHIDGFRVVRLQSSHFEANAMWTAIMDVDYAFLVDAATTGVILYDCGSRNGAETRAQWKGVPWLTFAYATANGGEISNAQWRYNWLGEFDHFYAFGEPHIAAKAKAKLRYVGRLTGSSTINVAKRFMSSTMDGRVEELAAGLNQREAA